MFSREQMQRAIEDALKSMEGVALELYRRGREEAREELETVKRERTSCPDCAMWAERSARWHDDMQRAERERDQARDKYEALAVLVDGYRRERDEAREERDLARERFENAVQSATRYAVERGEARAEVERLRAEAAPMNEHFTAGYRDGARDAYRRGAEAMREACAVALMSDGLVLSRERAANVVRALPIPEEP